VATFFWFIQVVDKLVLSVFITARCYGKPSVCLSVTLRYCDHIGLNS